MPPLGEQRWRGVGIAVCIEHLVGRLHAAASLPRRPVTVFRPAPTGTLPRVRYIEVNGIRLSSIGLGTWQFGSKEWGYGAAYARDEAGKIAARALELSINLIDTAEIYGRNESER